MTATPIVLRPASSRSGRLTVASSGAVILLELFAITLYAIPSDAVIRAIGANGYAAALVGLLAMAVWLAVVAFGVHHPRDFRHPMRVPLLVFWTVGLLSYFLMNRREHDEMVLLAADRWLLLLAMITGIVLVAAEGLRSLDDVKRVLRVVVWGGSFAGVVGAMQFFMDFDLTPTLRSVPGFSLNADNVAIAARADVARVAGTAIHAIELGVVAGMLLPLGVYLAMTDRHRRALWRWLPVACIGVAVPVAVSRSGVISAFVALAVFIVLLPAAQRLYGLVLVPLTVLGVYMALPSVVNTLTGFFEAGTNDTSVATRVDDYPLVVQLVGHHPFFGQGGGSYIARDAYTILDNEYLKTSVELGLVGLVALVLFLASPVVTSFAARRRSDDLELRTLCGALAGAGAAGLVCSATFDSFSFPMFVGTEALVVGLSACVWRLTREQQTTSMGAP